jgi:hypothetical protein
MVYNEVVVDERMWDILGQRRSIEGLSPVSVMLRRLMTGYGSDVDGLMD